MKMNKKMREAALTAMITLALSGTAMAMPSGGSVTQGSVSVNGAVATTIDSVASGATIAANGHSIIDWKAFGIEAGQKLSFDTSNGALLNRVIGNDISKILGSLVQKGECPLLLVNPNGILVGGNATIDASQLVLSTLAMSTDDFNRMNNGAGGLATFAKAANAGLGHIQVEKGAKINIDDVLLMAGGTVNVADGVTFTTTGKTTDGKGDAIVEIAAADKIVVDSRESKQDAIIGTESNKNNAVSFHGAFNNANTSGNTNFHIDGGTVNLDNAKIKLNDKSEAYLVAGNKATNSATTDNVISGKNMTIEGGKETVIGGGKVTLEDSKVESNGKISVGAGTSFMREEGENSSHNIVAAKASTGNEVVVKNSALRNNSKEIQVSGGKITVDKSTIESKDTAAMNAYKDRAALNEHKVSDAFENGNTVTVKNNSTVQAKNTVVVTGYDVEKSATSTIQSAKDLTIANRNYKGSNITPTVVADSATTGYAVAPEAGKASNNNSNSSNTNPNTNNNQAAISADDKENVAAGAKVVSTILGGSSKMADRQEAVVSYVGKLNDAEGSARAKAAQIYGMLKELEGMKSAEGNILMLTVLNAYEPTKNVKAQGEQAKTAEGKAVAAHTTDARTAQATTGANESADDMAVDASAVAE
jgi:filamentous hemagglutinin family protein